MNRFLILLLLLTGCASLPKRERRVGALDRLVQADQVARRLPAHVTPFHLRWPLRKVEITSGYGKRGREFHEGVDLRAKNGTSVYASESGIVLYAATRIRGYGRMVVVQHPGKVATVYAHNSKVLVHPGQKVSKGQRIAFSGHSGKVSGPHVHFEVRYGVAPVDPLLALATRKVEP